MSQDQYNESFKALGKALDAIEAAEYDLAGNFASAATNRAYYACYYCMTALLLTKGVYSKTHQGTRAKFSELFIKTNIFPEYIASNIKIAFDLRQEADYDLDADITAEEAKDVIGKTAEFYRLSQLYLQDLK